MKKVLELLLIVSLAFLLTACESTPADDSRDDPAVIVEPAVEPADSEEPAHPQEQDESLFCPDCGGVISEEWIYCAWCGLKLNDDGKEEPWHTLISLNELDGTWTSEDGVTVRYPDYSLGTGQPMISITMQPRDDTTLWRQWANRLGYTLGQTWNKRNILRKDIYGPVLVDENGTQIGILCTTNASNFIYSSEIIFLPEKIVRDNSAFFEFSPDGTKLTMKGSFHFFSDIIYSLEGSESIFEKIVEEDTNE